MFNGLKNFAINKILRHLADNPRLNRTTNVLAVLPAVISAALAANADWTLILSCCSKPGSLAEVTRIAGTAVGAVLLFYCGKFTWLKQWLPVADEIIEEAEKDVEKK